LPNTLAAVQLYFIFMGFTLLIGIAHDTVSAVIGFLFLPSGMMHLPNTDDLGFGRDAGELEGRTPGQPTAEEDRSQAGDHAEHTEFAWCGGAHLSA
jgi:hypothetical protein